MDNEIRIDDLCLDVSKSHGPVTMVKCHHLKGNQYWEYDIKVRKFKNFEKYCVVNYVTNKKQHKNLKKHFLAGV